MSCYLPHSVSTHYRVFDIGLIHNTFLIIGL